MDETKRMKTWVYLDGKFACILDGVPLEVGDSATIPNLPPTEPFADPEQVCCEVIGREMRLGGEKPMVVIKCTRIE